jgi:methylmalonyl-CoA mutase cobalamin-binding domain/chain
MNNNQAIQNVFQSVVDLDIDQVAAQVHTALENGFPALQILSEGLAPGVRMVGERYERGEYYLTDLVLAGEVMKAGLVPLEPFLSQSDVSTAGMVVLATVKGDIHEIGKNLVATMLRSAGFQVIDLGVDVPAQRIVETARQKRADLVGLSVLLTPMVNELVNVLDGMQEAGLRPQVKVIIGGACTTPELATKLGADGHGADAVAAVRLCEQLLAT